MNAENHTRDASLLESYFFDWLLLDFYSSFHTFLLAKWEKRLKSRINESTLSTAARSPFPNGEGYEMRIPLFSHCQNKCMHMWENNTDGQSLPRVGKVTSEASRIGY